jgi:Kef-type K+ transport system membrane component KefB
MFIEQKTTRVEHSGFITAMAIAFLYAFVAETIGISAIVGAFVAGTMFSEVPIKREFHEGTRFLGAVFGPIFFISIGIVVDFKCMFITYDGSFTWNYFLLGTLLAILGLFTKIIGCGIPAKLFKLSVKDSLMVGAGMAPRGEVALIMAMYMLILGLLTPQLYAAVVLMAICTTLIPIPLLKWLAEYRQKPSSNYKKFKL